MIKIKSQDTNPIREGTFGGFLLAFSFPTDLGVTPAVTSSVGGAVELPSLKESKQTVYIKGKIMYYCIYIYITNLLKKKHC